MDITRESSFENKLKKNQKIELQRKRIVQRGESKIRNKKKKMHLKKKSCKNEESVAIDTMKADKKLEKKTNERTKLKAKKKT